MRYREKQQIREQKKDKQNDSSNCQQSQNVTVNIPEALLTSRGYQVTIMPVDKKHVGTNPEKSTSASSNSTSNLHDDRRYLHDNKSNLHDCRSDLHDRKRDLHYKRKDRSPAQPPYTPPLHPPYSPPLQPHYSPPPQLDTQDLRHRISNKKQRVEGTTENAKTKVTSRIITYIPDKTNHTNKPTPPVPPRALPFSPVKHWYAIVTEDESLEKVLFCDYNHIEALKAAYKINATPRYETEEDARRGYEQHAKKKQDLRNFRQRINPESANYMDLPLDDLVKTISDTSSETINNS